MSEQNDTECLEAATDEMCILLTRETSRRDAQRTDCPWFALHNELVSGVELEGSRRLHTPCLAIVAGLSLFALSRARSRR